MGDVTKVKTEAVCVPSTISVRKFHDSNANGIQDANEPDLEWLIDITDPAGSPNTYLSPLTVLTTLTGTWQICEQYDSRWIQIALFVDSAAMPISLCAGVTVSAGCDEVHEVVFGNIQAGSITACKFNDENVNGIRDIGELPVEGVRFVLSGSNIRGESVDLIAYTGADGCVSFTGLLPGSYELCEVVPINWTATTDECRQITLEEGQDISFDFGNFCGGFADFNTKGYWHNKNGLDETEDADIAYINTLAPWLACSTNTQPFGPINGKYCSGSNVPAAKVGGAIIAPAGTPKAEQSIFLVYKNSIVKLQLAQQLYAFILNVRHRLTECGPDSWILLSDGTWKQASVLISEALAKWASGTNAERSAITKELDWLNNSMVAYRSCTPCEIVYPLP
ncbi:MAG TPA: SdrD B-like domain-containing protein [Anaerohalosphaeraceae bacterium]|nr:SdrD B-like domain-containing protein [Anaerohalosphaeraceae bacterium]HOL32827.1 SdrD B-like domain-containing protein [Anaerohalosphaeraceae bacterium]HOM76151.1 SdrD B-like domain-containing protein [Anaerohalosphaeraceae bacterium]HPO71104.1 SdrD B-like domain-containing protein [Anaerohalosphaeraceae bacterium]HRV19100.1 SdrD B-like domain-containing protein [Anaerohalosphaeraceae bacterium]